MKKNILLNAALSLATAFVLMALPACKKSPVEPQAPTKQQLITKEIWKFVKVEEKTGTAPWVDISNIIHACESDNYLVYRSDLTYELNEGITKCDLNDPQIVETGIWSFANNETQMSFTPTGSSYTDVAEIVELTDHSLVLNRTYNNNGTIYQYRISYSH